MKKDNCPSTKKIYKHLFTCLILLYITYPKIQFYILFPSRYILSRSGQTEHFQYFFTRYFLKEYDVYFHLSTINYSKIHYLLETKGDKLVKRFFCFYSDEILLQWLETLAIYGISIIKSCGLEHDRINNLASRVAFLKKTHYG